MEKDQTPIPPQHPALAARALGLRIVDFLTNEEVAAALEKDGKPFTVTEARPAPERPNR